MKLLLTSVDAVIDYSTGKPFEGILQVFNFFRSLEEGNEVIVISSHEDKLSLLPKEVHSALIKGASRGSDSPIKNYIFNETEYNDRSKIIVLAANDADFFTAVNTKLLLLGARYAMNYLNEDSKAYKYGLQIESVDKLGEFFERFFTIDNPWFYRLNIGEKFRVYSLTNANTKGAKSQDAITLNNKFKECLKKGNSVTRYAFLSYFIMGIYDIVTEVENIHYWGIYPSSTVEQESDLEHFKELARTTFKVISSEPLFIRHKQSIKRSNIWDPNQRVDDGCENQFETMYINPYYKKKLIGKTVGVIDDFTSYGTSAETVRALLEKSGVAKIIFITLGKFGKPYYKYNYELKGDIFSPAYTATRKGNPVHMDGTVNQASDNAFVTSLKGLV